MESVKEEAQPVSDAARALDDMRRTVILADAPVQEVSAAALVAIAEQLAVLNEHLATMTDAARLYTYIHS